MENDRDTSLQSWEFLTLFLPRSANSDLEAHEALLASPHGDTADPYVFASEAAEVADPGRPRRPVFPCVDETCAAPEQDVAAAEAAAPTKQPA